jgi:hypothetical protein
MRIGDFCLGFIERYFFLYSNENGLPENTFIGH